MISEVLLVLLYPNLMKRNFLLHIMFFSARFLNHYEHAILQIPTVPSDQPRFCSIVNYLCAYNYFGYVKMCVILLFDVTCHFLLESVISVLWRINQLEV